MHPHTGGRIVCIIPSLLKYYVAGRDFAPRIWTFTSITMKVSHCSSSQLRDTPANIYTFKAVIQFPDRIKKQNGNNM